MGSLGADDITTIPRRTHTIARWVHGFLGTLATLPVQSAAQGRHPIVHSRMPLLAVMLFVVVTAVVRTQVPPPGDWPVYGGDAGGRKYSTLTAITSANVATLQKAWEWKTGEQPNQALGTFPGALASGTVAGFWFVRAGTQFYLGRRPGDWFVVIWFSLLGALHVIAAVQ